MMSNKINRSVTADFLEQNNPFKAPKRRVGCMFHQDSQFKFGWDIMMTALLLVICFCMPIHLAFKNEDNYWCWSYFSIDTLFVVDIVFTFFTTIPEREEEEELTDRKQIAKEYLTGWFFIEFVAIIPVDIIFSSYGGSPKLCSLGNK